MRSLYVWPVIATTGAMSSFASYRPFNRWIPPGPEVAMHAPSFPVNLAYAHAAKAAASSWRTSTKRMSSCRSRSASISPLMPSPRPLARAPGEIVKPAHAGPMRDMRNVRVERGILHVEDQPRFFLATDYPYFRDDPGNWAARLRAQKECGLDVLTTYVPWRHHMVAPHEYDFTGRTQANRDLVRFLDLAQAEELPVIVKPGPFV